MRQGFGTLGIALLFALPRIQRFAGPRLKALLLAREWSDFAANVAVVFAGGLLLTATFLLITLTLIFTVQLGLRAVGESLGLAPELSHYGSWLLAIVVVGWPAEIVAKRLGIDLTRRPGRVD